MNSNYYAVIMAGGVGSRFWPMSTQNYPKQFHDMLGDGESLIQKSYNLLTEVVNPSNILVSTNSDYKQLVLDHLPEINENQLLLEPVRRNNAASILYASFKIFSRNKEAKLMFLPSDQLIPEKSNFTKSIISSFEFCDQKDVLMTLGIKPNNPNTGFGYIQFENENSNIKKVKQFTEKPNLETAKSFIKSGDYLWNAGIFVWSANSILKAFEQSLPTMYQLFKNGEEFYNTSNEIGFINGNYERAENISIDYGILEKAENVYVLPVNFGWNDLGTWGSLYNKLPKDKDKNSTVGGEVIFRDASNNMVYTQNHKKVIIQGLNDYIVVEKDGVLLICPKADEQDIKQITAQAKKDFGDEYV